jgi:hypothetical protein
VLCLVFLFVTFGGQTIGGMSVVAVLRNQKQGLLVRLGEQRRQLEQQQHEMIALQRAHRAAESLVAALRNTWNLLDDNLRLFVRRLDPENAGATPVGTASAASGTAVFSELVRFFRAFQPEISLDETRLVAELQQRVAATKQTLEQLAKLASSGAKNERFDEIHTAFAGLLQRFSALNERNETLKAEHEEFSKKCASLADEVALLSRKNDRLSEQLREAREEGVLRLSSSAVVPEPAEKKRKNDDEPQKVGNEELEALTTRVAFLVEENAKLAAERDNNLLSYRNITEVCFCFLFGLRLLNRGFFTGSCQGMFFFFFFFFFSPSSLNMCGKRRVRFLCIRSSSLSGRKRSRQLNKTWLLSSLSSSRLPTTPCAQKER